MERHVAKANMDWEEGVRAGLADDAPLPPKPLKLRAFNVVTSVICGALASGVYRELELQQKKRAREAAEQKKKKEKEERERPMSPPGEFEDWEAPCRPSAHDHAGYVTVEPSRSAENGKPFIPQRSTVSRYLWGG